MSLLLGIDVGTRACKILLFDLEGSIVAESTTEYDVACPKPTWAEQDPDYWWNAVVKGLSGIFEKLKVSNEEIVGIGIDSQREAVVPIDKNGCKIGNAIIWLDRRTMAQTDHIRELFTEEEIIGITGLPIGHIFSASKILWLMENRASVIRRTICFLSPKDYVLYRLTGEMTTDFSMASRTLLLDIHKKRWSSGICSALEIDSNLLPEIQASENIVGEVSRYAERETGLKAGTPVVAGGGDRPCEALGAGVVEVGQVNIGTGTGTTITTPLKQPQPDLSGKIACCCHVIRNKWEYEAGITTTGASLKWFKENFGHGASLFDDSSGAGTYAHLEQAAREIPAGSEGLFFYPYLSGAHAPYFDDHAKGVFLGFTLRHRKAHFVRAIFEGVAYQYPGAFRLLENLNVAIREIRMVGRETMNDCWNQLKSDVTGKVIAIPKVRDSAALGSAILAGIGTRIYHDEEEAVRELVKVDLIYRPDKKISKKYEHILKEYDAAYQAIRKAFKS